MTGLRLPTATRHRREGVDGRDNPGHDAGGVARGTRGEWNAVAKSAGASNAVASGHHSPTDGSALGMSAGGVGDDDVVDDAVDGAKGSCGGGGAGGRGGGAGSGGARRANRPNTPRLRGGGGGGATHGGAGSTMYGCTGSGWVDVGGSGSGVVGPGG